jgi:branched-chain amino acid transport system permease protein
MLGQILLNGIIVGSIYALIAIGFVVVYRSVAMFNFAQTEYYTFGGMLFATLLSLGGVPLLAAIAVTAVAGAALGVASERLAFRRLLRVQAPQVNLIIASIALAIILRSLILLAWGADARRVQSVGDAPLALFGLLVTPQQLFVVGATLAIVALLYLFLQRTRLGLALRATASNRDVAGLMGIPLALVLPLAFGLSAAIGSLGGVLIAPILLAQFTMGQAILVKAFAAAIVGGLLSIPGVIVGGLIVGLAENLAGGYVSSAYKDVVAFAVLIVVLAVRPTGILGTRTEEKV